MALDKVIPSTDDELSSARSDGPFTTFAVKDLDAAREFYRAVLGLRVVDTPMGVLGLHFSNGTTVVVYPKPDHEPAVFTILNFPVSDLVKEVDRLAAIGIAFLRYEGFDQDERGIAAGNGQGPDMAWFKDPSGNILAVLET